MSYWPVSANWAGALAADPFTPYSYVDVFAGLGSNQPLNSAPLLVTDGSISWDTTASIRRTASQVTFVSPPGLPLVPNQAGDLLFPDGIEFAVYKGFLYPDGTTEVCPQGRFLMDDAVVLDASSGSSYNLTIAIDGSDRMEEVQRNEFTQSQTTTTQIPLAAGLGGSGADTLMQTLGAMTVPPNPYVLIVGPGSSTPEQVLVTGSDSSGTYLTVVRGYNGTTIQSWSTGVEVAAAAEVTIAGLVYSRLPGVPMNLTPSADVVGAPSWGFILAPASYSVGDDPSAFIAAQALAAGMECYFDRIGTFTLVPIVDPATVTPIPYQMVEGQAGTTFTQLQRTLSNQGVPNWIIVISQGSNIATPLRADWQDTNPNSYTYIDGNYPTTVEVIQTSTATTQAQVQAMANALGLTAQGIFDSQQVSYYGDPAIGDGDVVLLTRSASRMNASPYAMQQGQLYLDTSNQSTLTGYRVIPGT